MKTNRLIVLAAAAAVSALSAGAALAQQRVGSDGRALDANNRIGSGGLNEPTAPQNSGPTANDIVYGNVTQGKAFGVRPTSLPPGYFRAPLSDRVTDEFIRDSVGVPSAYGAAPVPNEGEVYYGRQLVTPPPAGFQQQGFSGTYTPAPLSGSLSSDPRLNMPIDPKRVGVPLPGEMVMPGPVDPGTRDQTVLTGSPLMGIRQWNLGDYQDRSFLNQQGLLGQPDAMDRLRLDPRTLEQMRNELSKTGGELNENGQPKLPNNMTRAELTTGNLATGAGLRNKPLDQALNTDPLSGEVRQDQSMYIRTLVPPSQQSSQYAEMRNRLNQYYTERLSTDEDRNREVLAQLRAQKELADRQQQLAAARSGGTEKSPPTTQPQGPAALKTPDYARISRELVEKTLGKGGTAQPGSLKVQSLATGVKAPGLARLLAEGESLMKQGKYTSALDQYDAAAQVAPNNPLVWLGRSVAELGAAYYTKSEQHIRQAFGADPTLLMGQYDLNTWIGNDRLAYLVKDLKEIARTHENEVRPVFLLAFIAYNTGNADQAKGYLDLAEKRAQDKDLFLKVVREHWKLSSATTRPAR